MDEAYRSLVSEVCPACGKKKSNRKTVCWTCWGKLPARLKRQSYEQDGYPETFRTIVAFLKERP